MREVSGDYTVQYNSRSHLGVIFQRHGSVWPRVLPSCIANVLLTLLCRYYIYPWMEDEGLAVSGQGHDKSNFIISFFVVSRCTMALKRNTDAHANLFMMTQATRELISSIVSIVGHLSDETEKRQRLASLLNLTSRHEYLIHRPWQRAGTDPILQSRGGTRSPTMPAFSSVCPWHR